MIFFVRNHRYADIINGIGCKGLEVVREEDRRNLRTGEYLYGFRKESRLHPVITFILYSGEEHWNRAGNLLEILDLDHIPEIMRKYVSDYRINVVDIRRLKDTSVFKTDVKQVFDFLRCCDDREKLEALLKNDKAFRELEEDTVKLLKEYADSASLKELLEAKKYQEGENRNMCKGL